MRTKRSVLVAVLFSGIAAAQNAPQNPPKASLSVAIARNNEGVRLADRGNTAEAERAYRAALEAGCDDDLVLAKIFNNLGVLYQRQERYAEAGRMLRSALELRQKNLPPASIEVAYSLNNLAEVYIVQGRDWEARKLLETATGHLQDSHADAPGVPIILANYALVLCRFNQFDQAEEVLRSALNLYNKDNQAKTRGYGVALNCLGQVLGMKNDFEAAASVYEQAIGVFEPLGESAQSDLAATLANTGELYQRLDRTAEARAAEEKALKLLHPTGDALLRVQILRNMGNIVAKTSKPADALPYFEQSLAIQDKTLGVEHPTTASLLFDYASATKRAGNRSLYRKLRKRAEALLERMGNQSLSQMTVSLRDLRNAK